MGRTVSIGAQDFAELREGGYFLVDKTDFIRRWWRSGDKVTLVCRPRRFGKTLALSMVECFFSCSHAGRGLELFAGLDVWKDPSMRELQGSMPVVALSFADCKGASWEAMRAGMCYKLRVARDKHGYLLDSEHISEDTRAFLARIGDDMPDEVAAKSIQQLCAALEAHHGRKPLVLLDEYDTPMQEAWTEGWWDEMTAFVRGFFNSTFKTNPALGRALITGMTRVASESIFSDMNNPRVVTTTSAEYADCFGFTEGEVFSAMKEAGLDDREGVRRWYDGFTFGETSDIYNPWSITNYLKERRFAPYWANTSSNGLVSTLLRGGDGGIQGDFERLLGGELVQRRVDERVPFRRLGADEDAVWSLLLAAGYLRADDVQPDACGRMSCRLSLTNLETRACFDDMVREWFAPARSSYNGFTRALLAGDYEEAGDYLGAVLTGCISAFDGGSAPSAASQPERFYHGLVLGMLVDLRGRYEVTSNRESGFGRYDVMLRPLSADDPALVMEFKVRRPKREATLEDTLERARAQLRERGYARQLEEAGIEPDRIREIGFAFEGKKVLVG